MARKIAGMTVAIAAFALLNLSAARDGDKGSRYRSAPPSAKTFTVASLPLAS